MINAVSNKQLKPFSRNSTIEEKETYQHKSSFRSPQEDEDALLEEILEEERTADLLSAEEVNFLRDFIVNSALYVEELEDQISEHSDDFWESREHAYRIITGLLIDLYQCDLAE